MNTELATRVRILRLAPGWKKNFVRSQSRKNRQPGAVYETVRAFVHRGVLPANAAAWPSRLKLKLRYAGLLSPVTIQTDQVMIRKKMEKKPPKALLPSNLQTALVFAARYAHGRNTSASYIVNQALRANWENLSPFTQAQLISESCEARYCLEDWEWLRNKEKTP